MLLWIPPCADTAAAATMDDNEKGDKLRRRAAEARVRNILMAAGLFILAFFATISQVQYTQKRHPQQLLRQATTTAEEMTPEQEAKLAAKAAQPEVKVAEEAVSVDDFFVSHAHLPENSIYRLSLTDVTGNSVDLSQFSGMVSLVVNTACH